MQNQTVMQGHKSGMMNRRKLFSRPWIAPRKRVTVNTVCLLGRDPGRLKPRTCVGGNKRLWELKLIPDLHATFFEILREHEENIIRPARLRQAARLIGPFAYPH